MISYIVKRLGQAALVLWGALSLLWVLIEIMPGSIVSSGGDIDRSRSAAVTANLEKLYGLNDPLPVQYFKALKRVVTLDFGQSATNRNIREMLGESIGASMRLAFWGILFYAVLGTLLGVRAAVRQNRFIDRATGFFSIFLVALPPFVMGILLQIMLGVWPFQKKWPKWLHFPIQWDQSRMSWFGPIPLGGSWRYLMLPVVTVACVNLGVNLRASRAAMLEVLRADYLRTARAKGLAERRVVYRHGLRNAMIPIITGIGTEVPNILGFAILTETVWNVPGLGTTIAQAVGSQDSRTTLAFCSVIVLITVVTSLVVDISYGVFDPRVRVTEQ